MRSATVRAFVRVAPAGALVLLLAGAPGSLDSGSILPPAFAATVRRDPEQLEPLFAQAREQAHRGASEDAGRTAARIAEYLDALADGGAEPFLIPGGESLWVEARLGLFDLIASLPEEGRSAFRAAREPTAQGLVDRAIASRDADALERAAARFAFTPSGERARRAVAAILFEAGDLARAARWLAAADSQAAGVPETLQRIYCLARLGRRPEAESLALRVAGTVDLGRGPVDARALAGTIARLPADPEEAPGLASWTAFGGNSAHTGSRAMVPALGFVEATLPLAEPERLDATRARFEAAGVALPRVGVPASDGRVAVVPGERSVSGIDLQTGTLCWSRRLVTEGLEGRVDIDRRAPALLGDRAFVLVSAYLPPTWEGPEDDPVARVRVEHRLVALDVGTGAVAWEVPIGVTSEAQPAGPAGPAGEAVLPGGLWVAPPVAALGRVFLPYVRVAGSYEARVLALDARTGRPLWDRQIGSDAVRDRLARAVIPTPAAVVDGTLYVQTGIGLLGVLDGVTGDIRWILETGIRPGSTLVREVEEARRFEATPPRLVGRRLLLSPPESDRLMAIDVDRRTVVWEFPRDAVRQVVGVAIPDEGTRTPGRVFLAGPASLLALDITTGAVAWGPVALPAPLAGVGAAGRNEILIPTATDLLAFDPTTGAPRDRMAWLSPDEAGHLALAGDRVIVSGADAIRVLAPADAALAAAAASASADARVREGEILLRRREPGRALERLDAAIAALRPDPRRPPVNGPLLDTARSLAFRAARALAEGRPPAERAAVLDRALRYSSSGPEELRTILDRAEALADAGLGPEACQAFDLACQHYPGRMVEVGVGHLARVEAYVSSRIQDLIRRFGRAVYEPLEAAAAQRFDESARTGTAQGYRDLVARYPQSRIAPAAYRALEDHYAAANLLDQAAEITRRFVTSYPDDPETGPAIVRLVERYESIRRYRDARWALDRLAERFGGATLDVAGRTIDVTDYVRRRLAEPAYRRAGPAEAWLPEDLRPVWQTMTDLNDRDRRFVAVPGAPPDLIVVAGPAACEARLSADGAFLWEASLVHLDELIDGVEASHVGQGVPPQGEGPAVAPGVPPGPVPFPVQVGTAVLRGAGFVGDRIVLALDEGIVAASPEGGEVAWIFDPDRATAPGAGPPGPPIVPEADPDPVRGVAFGPDRVYCLIGPTRIAAVDGTTGALVWVADLPRAAGGSLAVAGDVLAVGLQRPAGIIGFRAADGARAYEVPFPGPPGTTIASGPTLAAGLLVTVHGATPQTSVAASDPQTGELRWVRTFGFPLKEATGGPGDGRIAVLTAEQAQTAPAVLVLDAQSGQLAWQVARSDGRVREVRDAGELLLVLLERFDASRIVAYRAQDGAERWRYDAQPPEQFQSLALSRRYVIAANRAPTGPASVHVLDRESGGAVTTLALDGRRIRDVRAADGRLVLETDRGLVAYGLVDRDLEAQIACALLRALAAPTAPGVDPAAIASDLAARYLQMDEDEEARRVLEETLYREDLAGPPHPALAERIYRQLASVVERRADEAPPEMHIHPFAVPPAIDGDLGDWYDPTVRVGLDGPSHVFPVQSVGQPAYGWAGAEDLGGTLYLGYDERFLYIALDVDDSVLRAYDSEADTWIGDCLLIGLDMLGDGGPAFRSDDQLLSLALTQPRQNPPGQDEEQNRPAGKYFVKRRDDETGAVYEARIPWDMFRDAGAQIPAAGPAAGFRFGLDIVVTDDDSAEGSFGRSRQALTWTPGILLHESKDRLWTGFIPDRFARIVVDPR